MGRTIVVDGEECEIIVGVNRINLDEDLEGKAVQFFKDRTAREDADTVKTQIMKALNLKTMEA